MERREQLCEEIQGEYQRFYQDIMVLPPEDIDGMLAAMIINTQGGKEPWQILKVS